MSLGIRGQHSICQELGRDTCIGSQAYITGAKTTISFLEVSIYTSGICPGSNEVIIWSIKTRGERSGSSIDPWVICSRLAKGSHTHTSCREYQKWTQHAIQGALFWYGEKFLACYMLRTPCSFIVC